MWTEQVICSWNFSALRERLDICKTKFKPTNSFSIDHTNVGLLLEFLLFFFCVLS